MHRPQHQQQQQQQRKFFHSDNDPVDMQEQQNFRMQNNRRRVGNVNNGRQNHRGDSYYPNNSGYSSRNHSARNGSSQTSFTYSSEQIISRTSSRMIIRSGECNGHSDLGQHPCPVQQRPQPPHRIVSNPATTLQPHPHISRAQHSAPPPMQTNFVGYPCYSIIVPPNPIPEPMPGYLQQQTGYAYGEADLQPNLQLCPTQPTKFFFPVVQHICPIPGRFLPKIERKRNHALDIIDPVTQRNIFEPKIENGSKEVPLAPKESKSNASDTHSLSLEPPKCVTRSVVAVPNQIQAAAAMEEIGHDGERDLQSLKFVDMLQHHNISVVFPDDTDREVSEIDLSETETKSKSAVLCYGESKESDIEEGATGENTPSYLVEFSSAAEDSDGIKAEFENAGNKTPINIPSYIRSESSYSSCSDMSTTDDTKKLLKKQQIPSSGPSSLQPKAVSLSSLLSDISSASITISSDNPGRNYEDDETVDEETDMDNLSGNFNLGEILNLKVAECKRYSISELKLIQKLPASRVTPKVEEKAKFLLTEGRYQTMRDLRPSFSRSSGMNQRQGQYMRYNYAGMKPTKPISRSNDPPKLNEISNAWRPKKLRKSSILTPETQAQEELFQNVRGILNKLTKEKFDVLTEQILDLAIDTKDKIYGVMLLIFEKAIDEPHFSQSYAMLCRRLVERQLHVKSRENTELVGGFKEETCSKIILFKTALLDKTQSEFFRNVVDKKTKYEKLKPIMERIECCQDTEKAAELKMLLAEKEKLFRLRSVGTVKFIGELYRTSMLTTNIITNCIQCLLDANCDDKLECLCKLLTTVGEKYETTLQHERTNTYYSLKDTFKRINEIITLKRNCNRVRFMLQDMVDTRNKWLPKLKTLKSKADSVETKKTPEPTHKLFTAESEKSRLQGLNYYNLKTNSESGGSLERAKSHNFGKKNRVNHQEGKRWEAIIREKSPVVPHIDPSKLGAVRATTSMPASFSKTENLVLGNSSCFKWHRETKTGDNTGRSMPLLPQLKNLPKTTTVAPLPQFAVKMLSEEMNSLNVSDSKSSTTFDGSMDEKCIELCKTTIIHMVTTAIEDSLQDAIELLAKISPDAYTTFIYTIFSIYLHSGGVKQEQRKKAADIVLELMRLGRLKEENLLEGYQRFSEEISDLIIDVPDAWSYIFEFIGPIIESGYINLRQLWNQELKTARMGKKFLKHLLQHFIENGRQSSIAKAWRESKLQRNDFLAENDVREFIEENNFDFIDEVREENNVGVVDELQKEKKAGFIGKVGKEKTSGLIDAIPESSTNVGRPPLNTRDLFSKLAGKIKGDKQPELTIAFINSNLAASVDYQFIVDLTNFLIKVVLTKRNKHLNLDRPKLLRYSVPILKHFIDNNKGFELAALEAIEGLVLNGGCPSKHLKQIFYSLFDAGVVHKDTFIKWRSLQTQPMQKILSGGAMMSFYNILNVDGSSSDD